MRDDGREVRRTSGHSNEPAIQVICLVSRSQSLRPHFLLVVIYVYMERGGCLLSQNDTTKQAAGMSWHQILTLPGLRRWAK
jgi:hypothetical protein